MVDDQLAATAEKIRQLQFTIRPLKVVVLVDPHPGQSTAFGAELVPFFGKGFFVGQVLFAGDQPFFPRYDGMILNVHGVFLLRGAGSGLTQPSRLTFTAFDRPLVGRCLTAG
ncbi:hypothetical protein D3C85_1438840 [compost metagenome]